MQIVVRTVGRHLIVCLVAGGIAIGTVGCGTERIEPAPLAEVPPSKQEPKESDNKRTPASKEEDEDSGVPTQQIVVDCATISLPIPGGWKGQQTGEGTWTYGAPDQAGELTIDGEFREGTDAFQNIAQLAAQLGWEDADTKTYGKGGLAVVGDSVEGGTEWHLGMVAGEANQVVNLTFEYDASAESTDEVEAAKNDVATMATGATFDSTGTCEDL